jgi:pimeloyl-ACP methyl ester carboxylesterase
MNGTYLIGFKKTGFALLLTLLIFSGIVQAQTREDTIKFIRKQIFPGARIAANHQYKFPVRFVEMNLYTRHRKILNGLLFKADTPKGVIFYLHGNEGSMTKWGKIAGTYARLHYDIFILDYPGYGKSEGTIQSEAQLYKDVQQAYYTIRSLYHDDHIIIMGYSIGTGPAAMLAAGNHPKMLILDAPYYSLRDGIHHSNPGLDTALIPFHFNTYRYLPKITAPIVIFHGDKDAVFYYGSSLKLKAFFKPGDRLITLKGAGHLDFEKNRDYQQALASLLK